VANQNWPNRSKFWSKIAKIGATPPRRDREILRREKNVLSKEILEQDVANQNWPDRSKFWSKIAKICATPPRRDRERLRREKNVLSKEILEVFC